LIHQTAKEFLIKPPDTKTAPTGSWKHSLNPKQSNLNLAKYCLWYLLFKEFGTGYTPLKDASPLRIRNAKPDSEIDQYLSNHHFLDYSARNWTLNFKAAEIVDENTAQLAFTACDVISKHFTTWFMFYWRQQNSYRSPPNSFKTLFVAAYFGLESITRQLIKNRVEVNSKDTHRRTPLSWAAENGHEAVVKLLLEKGAEVDSKVSDGRTPLLWAAKYWHEAVVKLLLDKGAKLDLKTGDSGTPLSWAAENGHEAVVELLLEQGAKVDSKGSNSRTPLSWAAWRGNEAVVKLLLEKGAKGQ
jgi:hypothetical protein